MTNQGTLRSLEPRDLDWVVDITRQRRERLVPHAPTLWRPSQDATERHRNFLRHLIDLPDVLSVRTAHGYLMAQERGGAWLVDDMVVEEPGQWLTEGVDLLRHALDRCGHLRFVVPAFETDRRRAAEYVGFTPAERWWHRDLPGTRRRGDEGRGDEGRGDGEGAVVAVEGASGRLVPAPPVYDPGGPVLLVTEVDTYESLRRIEADGARRSATVSVVSQTMPDLGLTSMLGEAGYVLTTVFFEGRTAPGPSRQLGGEVRSAADGLRGNR